MKKLSLINEQTSPLFRVMSVFNSDELSRRSFENNICAFHIGKGYVLSVAHNLRANCPTPKSFLDSFYQTDILPLLDQSQVQLFNQFYPLDTQTGKRHLIVANNDLQIIANLFKQVGFDTRWESLARKGVCTLYLVVQFLDDKFYKSKSLTGHFNQFTYFQEPQLNRHTFLIEIEIVKTWHVQDIALYKIINTQESVIKKLPSVEVDFSILKDSQVEFYCVQSSPTGFLGRLLNKASIEGYLDHHYVTSDNMGGSHIVEGLRYLIKGYFRFGSSGAPYVFYSSKKKTFKVNAIQSEACPIQLSINGSQNGNFQYINAIATPLNTIQKELEVYLA